MANAFILNQVPTGYGAAMSLIVEMLVSAGWTYKASGDGLSGFSSTGKIFSGTGSGALGWNNNRAWARVQDPGGVREICVQHNAANGIRLKYSASAKFVGGSPSATVVPSATDERTLWGAGSDATPTMSTWFGSQTASGTAKFHGRANGSAPYGFWMCSSITPGGAILNGLMMDPVSSVPEDIDPVIFHIGASGAYNSNGWGHTATPHVAAQYLAPGSTNQGCFGHRDAAATAFEMWFPAAYIVGSTLGHGATGNSDPWQVGRTGGSQNTFNLKYEAMPVPYIRAPVATLANPGFKGWGTIARWQWMTRVHAIDSLDNKNWIAIGYLWLPWDGTTAPTN